MGVGATVATLWCYAIFFFTSFLGDLDGRRCFKFRLFLPPPYPSSPLPPAPPPPSPASHLSQEHHFAACPPGHGYDTHRLWETLMAGVFPFCHLCGSSLLVGLFRFHTRSLLTVADTSGVFPVVISGPMDEMYKDLPIVVVKEWNAVTRDFLKSTLVQLRRSLLPLP